jgi:hypothetical protein
LGSEPNTWQKLSYKQAIAARSCSPIQKAIAFFLRLLRLRRSQSFDWAIALIGLAMMERSRLL